MKANATELRLDGDGEWDLSDAIEAAFGFPLAREDATCLTVGDVHALVLRKIGPPGQGRCASSMAFYRLRSALLSERAARADIRPATALRLLAGRRPLAFLRRLGRLTGLEMPSGAGVLSVAGLFISIAAVIIALFALFGGDWQGLTAAVGFGVLGAGLMVADPGRFPPGCATLGDLARRVAALNHARLVGEGAAVREHDVWQATAEIVSEMTGVPARDIQPQTWLFTAPKAA